MSNDIQSKITELIENADYGKDSVNEYIKTMGIASIIAKQLVNNGVSLDEVQEQASQESGTSSAISKKNSGKTKKAREQKQIMYELAEETMPKVFENKENLIEFLNLMSRFTNYTAINLLLLSAQCPRARLLKTFDDWKLDEFSIKGGQKSIKLFKFEGRKSDKNGKPYNDFSVNNVFDISQTDCQTEITQPTYDNKFLFTALIKDTKTHIKPVGNEELPEGRTAYFDEKQKTIFIAKDLPFCEQFNSLCCELLLSEIHSRDKNFNRNRYENDCICATYVVSKKYGIDTSFFEMNSLSEVCTDVSKIEGVDVRKMIERIRSNANSVVNRIDTYIERTQGKEVVR